MTFKTVLQPGQDPPITREEYGCMELYLVSKHYHNKRRGIISKKKRMNGDG